MPVTYTPTHFWAVVFVYTGSALPTVLPRALLLTPVSALALILTEVGWLEYDYSGSVDGLAIIVGLLIAFRLQDAYSKWNSASKLVLMLHAKTREVLAKLCAYSGNAPLAVPHIKDVRRLLVLACVTVKMHIRGESDFRDFLEVGLVTEEEVKKLTTRTCTKSTRDGKRDKFPSRNRPALVFHWAHEETSRMYRLGLLGTPNHHLAIEAALSQMSDIFEEIEHLGVTVLPIAYAQLTRVASLLFLIAFPFAYAAFMSWPMAGACLVLNTLFFTIDECASQMETPFGTSINDVELTKMLRRIDKHTAAQLGSTLSEVVDNFDIFPETRRTQEHHDDERQLRASLQRVPTYARLNGTTKLPNKGGRASIFGRHSPDRATAEETIGSRRGSVASVVPAEPSVTHARLCGVSCAPIRARAGSPNDPDDSLPPEVSLAEEFAADETAVSDGARCGADVEAAELVAVQMPRRCSSALASAPPPPAPLPPADEMSTNNGERAGGAGLAEPSAETRRV